MVRGDKSPHAIRAAFTDVLLDFRATERGDFGYTEDLNDDPARVADALERIGREATTK